MSSSNYRRNKAAIDLFRRQLKAEMDDISKIDLRILNQAVNEGMGEIKKNTPVMTGFMRRSWKSAPAVKSSSRNVKKVLVNNADYASYVNYGHRIVNKNHETIGFVTGNYILEKGVSYIDKRIAELFKAEIERIKRQHD